MAQHYTRNTVSAAAWCPTCAKQTQHRIDDRRIGACLECIDQASYQAEQYQERAAIKQHGGGMTCTEAERQARAEVYGEPDDLVKQLSLADVF